MIQQKTAIIKVKKSVAKVTLFLSESDSVVKGGYMIREVNEDEYEQLMSLYCQLHETSVPEYSDKTKELWQRLVNDPDYHLIAAEEDGKIVSSCTCIIVPNMTHGPRPYAFVENVVTDSEYRGRGLATACLEKAKEIAKAENCYRLILMTGSKLDSTLNFYRKAGYDDKEKTGFIQYLD